MRTSIFLINIVQLFGIFAAALVFYRVSLVREDTQQGALVSVEQSEPERSYARVVVPDPRSVAAVGVTLVPVVGAEEVLLIDQIGTVLNSWPIDAIRARLLPNGNLLVIHGTSSFGKHNAPWKDLKNVIREYSWDGEIVWEYVSSREIHHDVHRLPNGNTIFLESDEESLPGTSALDTARNNRLRFDIVKEITPDGLVVFEWRSIDHLDTSYCGWQGCAGRHETRRFRTDLHDWTHANTLSVLPENRL
jgi:hypothetical protein